MEGLASFQGPDLGPSHFVGHHDPGVAAEVDPRVPVWTLPGRYPKFIASGLGRRGLSESLLALRVRMDRTPIHGPCGLMGTADGRSPGPRPAKAAEQLGCP